MWFDKELEEKIKSRHYKDVINPNLEDQNYLSVFPSVKKKISIAKIRTNSHELHSETGHWSIPKTPWDERVVEFCTLGGVPHVLMTSLAPEGRTLHFVPCTFV
jgi:hypothetical protein